MKRKEFIFKTIAGGWTIANFSILDVFANTRYGDMEIDANPNFRINASLKIEVAEIFDWLNRSGWLNHLSTITGIDLSSVKDFSQDIFYKRFTADILNRIKSYSEYKDFGGRQFIEPGYPALSLVFHMVANPRVKPMVEQQVNYPTKEHIDTLEDYVYAIKETKHPLPDESYVLAILAYEYRTREKTPHRKYADFVYSRTGISRVGDCDWYYNNIERCFSNKPITNVKKIAAVPAKYGLFICRKTRINQLEQPEVYIKDGLEKKDITNGREILIPIRKIFRNDLLINNNIIIYEEHHLTEKLSKLVNTRLITPNEKVPLDGAPFIRTSRLKSSSKVESDELITMVQTTSCAWIGSTRAPLIQPAQYKGSELSFNLDKGILGSEYYGAWNTLDKTEDIEVISPDGKSRTENKYNYPRRIPLYLYIKALNEKRIPFYQDNICEGIITVDTKAWMNTEFIKLPVYPAFSIITAPDFFPQVDNQDLKAYDVVPYGNSTESNFYEGGPGSLSALRIRPNPIIISGGAIQLNETATTVISAPYDGLSLKNEAQQAYEPSKVKDYFFSSHLPDMCSSVFAPGWDITYSEDDESQRFLSTAGLGAPFLEDMKLCAAANGMWPASSPDAARTYQGSLTRYTRRNPTSIPLLDDELGYHKKSPYGIANNETYGWDGEQGPYLWKSNGQVYINSTSVREADYIKNVLDPNIGLDMSVLRELKSHELIERMEFLKKCIKAIDSRRTVATTDFWLIGAQKVKWGENFVPYVVPNDLIGGNVAWLMQPHVDEKGSISGDGYIYVFAKTVKREPTAGKRFDLQCTSLFACQCGNDLIAYASLIYRNRIVNTAKWEMA
jgi:hypothetical protein